MRRSAHDCLPRTGAVLLSAVLFALQWQRFPVAVILGADLEVALVLRHDPGRTLHLYAAASLRLNVLGTLGQDQLDLLLEAVGVGPNLRQLIAGEVIEPLERSNGVPSRCSSFSAQSAPHCHRYRDAGRQTLR